MAEAVGVQVLGQMPDKVMSITSEDVGFWGTISTLLGAQPRASPAQTANTAILISLAFPMFPPPANARYTVLSHYKAIPAIIGFQA